MGMAPRAAKTYYWLFTSPMVRINSRTFICTETGSSFVKMSSTSRSSAAGLVLVPIQAIDSILEPLQKLLLRIVRG